jgi:DNA-binding NarL/FixJ family response regulator
VTKMATHKRQALVVDDHPLIRDSIKELLKKTFPGLTVKTSSGRDGIVEDVAGTRWAVVVLDMNLPGASGLDILKKAKLRQPDVPIVVFSFYPQQQYAARAIHAGAVAYISKDSPTLELLKVVRRVLDGDITKQPMPPRPVLSDREMDVLKLIARGMKRREIAAQLAINEKTVSTYLGRLVQKLEVRNMLELIRYALEERLVP